jgi:group I intron endonuclease
MNNTNNNGSFISAIVYSNAETDKLQILSDNKGRAGIYMWTHKESNKMYVGSATDLSLRLGKYFSKNYLNRNKNMYICNALLNHGHSSFSLSILEYIDISNLSRNEAKTLILEREQHYLDTLNLEYNLLKKAGNSLGYKHNKESLAFMSEVKSGVNNHMFGKSHTADTKALISKSLMGKTVSEETKARMSTAKGTEIFVSSKDQKLIHRFSSARKAAEFLKCSPNSILKYSENGQLFKEEWFLSFRLSAK